MKMNYYAKITRSGPMVEYEYYKSIRPRGKNISRSHKKSLSTEKQKVYNIVQAQKKCQRIICCNFVPGDWYITLKHIEDIYEDTAKRRLDNFIKRLQRKYKKFGIELKYIGCQECGKRGKRWHAHLVINKCPLSLEELTTLWGHGRVWIESLYQDGNYKKLAEYIRKDVTGKRQLKQSKNLKLPETEVREMTKKEIRQLERNEIGQPPKGYYLVPDISEGMTCNDITGTSAHLVYMPIEYMKLMVRRI